MVEEEFFRPAETSPELFFSLLIILVLFLMLIFFGRKRQTLTDKIQNVKSYGELMGIVFNKRGYLEGDENKFLLKKAMMLRDRLSASDWAAIYLVAEPDSELEEIAEKKAGEELED